MLLKCTSGVEGIVGVLYSNLCYFRPPDPVAFVRRLFESCESCLRGNISSYLEHKRREKRVDPLAAITSGTEATDWRKVRDKLERNEKTQEEEATFRRFLDEGNEDGLTKAYKKVVQKKHNAIADDVISKMLDDTVVKATEAEEERKMETVRRIIELVLDEIFEECHTEEGVIVTRRKSKEISDKILDVVVGEVFNRIQGKSQIILNIIEIVTEQVLTEVNDKETIRILEENKGSMMQQIIDSVLNKMFCEPRKPEDCLTFTQLDVIIEATDKVMRDHMVGRSELYDDFIF